MPILDRYELPAELPIDPELKGKLPGYGEYVRREYVSYTGWDLKPDWKEILLSKAADVKSYSRALDVVSSIEAYMDGEVLDTKKQVEDLVDRRVADLPKKEARKVKSLVLPLFEEMKGSYAMDWSGSE